MGSRSSSTPTTTQSQYSDSRQVNDAGGGIVGSGNLWDQSKNSIDNSSTAWTQNTSNTSNQNWQSDSRNQSQTTWNSDSRSTVSDSDNSTWSSDSRNLSTNNWDASNRSTSSWTSDSRNLSTNNWDASNRSTSSWTSDSRDQSTTNLNVTDGGAIKAISEVGVSQSELLASLGKSMSATFGSFTDAGVKSQNDAISAVTDGNKSALDFASSADARAYKSSVDALGFVSDKFSEVAAMTKGLLATAQNQADNAASNVSAAYSSAANQANGNKTLTIAALAAVGLVAAVVIFK